MTQLEEAAERFDTCRRLAAFCRQQNIPKQNFHRRAKYWRMRFAFVYVEHVGHDAFVDEVDCVLASMVGSGS